MDERVGNHLNILSGAEFETPVRYHKDILHLMTRDTHTLFVYWEISNRKRWLISQHFGCDWGQMPKVLRTYNVTALYFDGHNAHAQFDILTTPEADNWFIHGVCADSSYIVDYGTYTREHAFIPLLRSNAVATPRDANMNSGAALLPAEIQVKEDAAGIRIEPQFFENIQPYSPTMR
jgi:hypothetical protein